MLEEDTKSRQEYEKSDLLTMCCVCGAIKIEDATDSWLNEEDDPQIYQEVVNRYNKKRQNGLPRISHGYCFKCYKIEIGKI